MSLITCPSGFGSNFYVQCQAIEAVENVYQGENFITCSSPFQLNSVYLTCGGNRERVDDLTTVDGNYYVVDFEQQPLVRNGYVYTDGSITNMLVSEYLESVVVDDPDPVGDSATTLSAADYSALWGMAATAFAIAWGFKMIVRQILNR